MSLDLQKKILSSRGIVRNNITSFKKISFGMAIIKTAGVTFVVDASRFEAFFSEERAKEEKRKSKTTRPLASVFCRLLRIWKTFWSIK
jgi:F0F1-type ATP synthase epsilon subunit